jgi:hypothetical protein
MVQQGQARAGDQAVQVVMLTHTARDSQVSRALSELSGAGFAVRPPLRIRVID